MSDPITVESCLRFTPVVLEVTTIEQAEQDDREYWRNASPHERLAALEATRRMLYGYVPDQRYLPGSLEIVECPWG